ncbi:SPFH domain-containing protein [Candidatus Chloroploca sp. M-50]|uniref:SPFH domain-containing protein n=1 Tax=Candidatus Chloroploca mongolica TaxID=2528176 RepID=A0ABS4DEI6_9CHLR|nr:SPFH domain-containing protein [Candidatus Chloroploca mongolica]MBP1467847.1 SPFH domain-containing protein [Candidatus Chloroploca mongolica]
MSQGNSPSGKSKSGGGARLSVLGVILLIVVVVGIGLSTMKFAQINEGERGLIVTQGRVEGVQEPGIFFRPFAPFTNIEVVNIRRQTRTIEQNVASSDKQLYDIDIQVDYSRIATPEALQSSYGEIGVDDSQLNAFLDGFINDALKSASTQFTLDQALSDRGGFADRIRQFLTSKAEGQRSPVEQLYVRLEAVKVLDIQVGEQYAQLLAEKANLEVQIETEEKRREQIQAQQSNNLFQAEQEATVALTRERGQTAAALEAASRESQVRAIQGRYWRENPELFELRQRELMVEMMKNGNMWFIDPNTDLTLLLNQMAGSGSAPVVPQPAPQTQPVPPEVTP